MKEIFKEIVEDTRKDITSVVMLLLPLLAFIILEISIIFLESTHHYLLVFDILEALFITICVSLIMALFIINRKIKKVRKYVFIDFLVSFVYIFIVLFILNLSRLSFINVLFLSLSESLVGVTLLMLTICFANTKESAVKMMSLSSAFALANILPIVVPGSASLSLSFIPSLWIGKYLYSHYFIFILWFIMIEAIWLLLLFIKFTLSQSDIKNHHN